MKLQNSIWLLATTSLLLFTNCKNDETIPTDCTGIEWSYCGNDGPNNWHKLCSGFSECAGDAQSPIDIRDANLSSTPSIITIDYLSSTTNIVNNGASVQFNMDAGSSFTLDGVTYELKQFHFHSSSEHTVDGQHYPMEAHLVHQEQNGTALAVVAIFFEEGAENAFLASQLANIPTMEGDTYVHASQVLASDLFPTELTQFYRYTGSLTTPPCSEIVSWMILKNPTTASATQLQQMSTVLGNNFRPTQDLNGRELLEYN